MTRGGTKEEGRGIGRICLSWVDMVRFRTVTVKMMEGKYLHYSKEWEGFPYTWSLFAAFAWQGHILEARFVKGMAN